MLKFLSNFNMCGFLPDNDGDLHDDFDSAKREIISRLKDFEESAESEKQAQLFCEAAESVNLESKPFSIIVCGWCFLLLNLMSMMENNYGPSIY